VNDFAYKNHLPCLNSRCKSHGKPHYGCLCYGAGGEFGHLSSGGEVSHFCSTDRDHNPDCEYFSGGGIAAPGFIPDAAPDFIPDTNASAAPEFIPDNKSDSAPDFIPDKKPDDSIGGTIKASAQGALEGIVPFAAPLQIAAGLRTKEDLAKEREEHPIAHGLGEAAGFAGSLLTPMSAFGAIGKAAEGVAQAAEIGKVGSAAIRAASEAIPYVASDELTKALIGQGDPEHPVSAALLNVGAAGLLGGLTGGAFTLGEGLIGKGVASEAGSRAASKAQEFLFDLGKHPNPLSQLGVSAAAASYPAYETSKEIENKTGMPLWMTYVPVEAMYTAMGNKAISKLNPYITAAAIKALEANEPSGIPNVFHYVAKTVVPGAKSATNGVAALFKSGSAKIAPEIMDWQREHVKKVIEGGGVGRQLQNSVHDEAQGSGLAHGGEVKSEPNNAFSKIFPAQNTILATAKGRVSNYLNSLRPQSNQPKAAFDDAPSTKEQERKYNKAIDLAVSPMSILDHINNGSLTPEHVSHFTALYPEVHRFLSKEMTKQITEAQLKKEKPTYGRRQAMSLFLGADLDSSLSPMAIQTVQALYANKQQAQQQQVPTKNKKGTSGMSKLASSHQTGPESRETRLQAQKP